MFGGCQFFDGKTFFCAYSTMCIDSNNSHHTWAKMPSVITALCTSTRICDVSIFRWPPTILHLTVDILQLKITITTRNSKRHELARKFFHSVCGRNVHRLWIVWYLFLSFAAVAMLKQSNDQQMSQKWNVRFDSNAIEHLRGCGIQWREKFKWKATFNVQKAARRQVLSGWYQSQHN